MIKTVQKLIDDYHNYLKEKTILEPLGEWIQITTPYLDAHNDYIQIYLINPSEDSYILTDDSHTLDDLEQSGYNINTSTNKEFLKVLLDVFGIQRHENELFVKTDHQHFAESKHNFLQVISAINSMFYKEGY